MEQADALLHFLRTARFRQGLVRDVRFVGGATRLLFIRAEGRPHAINCLFELDLASGQETLVLDPSVRERAGEGESKAELEAKQRTRELAGGINYFSSSLDGAVVVTSLGGGLVVGRRAADATWTWTDSGIRPAYSAQLNPDGTRACLLIDGRFDVVDLTGPEPEPRRRRPAREVPGLGRVDFVSAEEIDRRRAAWWHPDGTRLLVVAVDEEAVSEVVLSGAVDPSADTTRLRYPLAGTANATSSLWLVTVTAGDDPLAIERLPDPPGDWEYLVTAGWRDDGGAARAVWQTRDQRTVVGLEYHTATGWTELFRLTDPAWVPVSPGKYLLGPTPPVWIDESGERGVVVFGGDERAPTDGVSVRRLISATADGAVVDAIAIGSAAEGVAHVTRTGVIEWLSEPGLCADGWASTSGAAVLVQEEGLDEPRAAVARAGGSRDRRPVRVTAEVPALTPRPAFHDVPGRVRVAVLRPSGWAGERLPVVLDTYGGPGARRTEPRRRSLFMSQWLAEQGFAVVIVDGRGTPSPERSFERAIHRKVAETVLEDQLDGLDLALDRHPELDRDRVAVQGWSFGGFVALLCAHAAPDRFRAAVAGAPVTEWRWYDTHYTERYFGHPDEDPGPYDAASMIAVAGTLTVPTLLLHGLADDNVLPAHSLAYFRRGFPTTSSVEMVALPGMTHFPAEADMAMALIGRQVAFLHLHLTET